jgi:hypothetical protein
MEAQFEVLTGERLNLFLDKDAIKWGEGWQGKIDGNLEAVACFIPVMTPRYFMSAQCRRELQFFARRATQLGFKELVLPLLYVDVPVLHDDTATDDLVVLVRTFQREDWRELRYKDRSSEEYRRGVGRLAERLVEINREVEKSDVRTSAVRAAEPLQELGDEVPGFLDVMATFEEDLPKWTSTVQRIGEDVGEIAKVTQDASDDAREEQRTAGICQPRAYRAQAGT